MADSSEREFKCPVCGNRIWLYFKPAYDPSCSNSGLHKPTTMEYIPATTSRPPRNQQ